ncbi:MAG: hypothetical protein H0X24_11090 [Ktedonobacterales bacterium]|nr:hypothetical protein [Ktedonobacterales bacterium]
MYFDASNPYHRYRLHYESDNQLSVPEIIAHGSVDAHTAATIWALLDKRASYIIAGPTDPTPGVGKTTTLNALLPFYPAGTGLVYTLGIYEDFAFRGDVPPGETTVLANEVSDHLPIYMWGGKARTFLRLPADGYTIATSCHADALPDVLGILRQDLRLTVHDVHRIQIIVNIGLQGSTWRGRRRWLTTHFMPPATDDATAKVQPLPISRWDAATDTFGNADDAVVATMAAWVGMDAIAFVADVERRETLLQRLADEGADFNATLRAIRTFRGDPVTDDADALPEDEDDEA